MKLRFTRWMVLVALSLIGNLAWAQSQTPLDIALRHVEANYKSWNLTKADITDMVVSDMYKSEKSGLTHVYLKQRNNGITLQRGMINVNVMEDGRILSSGNRFVADLQAKVTASEPVISANNALQAALNELGISSQLPRVEQGGTDYKFKYQKGNVANYAIPVELFYTKLNESIELVWSITIDPIGTTDMWEYKVDAVTGNILSKEDKLIKCSFSKNHFHNHDAHCRAESSTQKYEPSISEALQMESNAAMAGSYRVFALPTESPIHGDHVIVTDPHDLVASPFGWHDTDGMAGAEYTITRGNNVHAFPDRDGDGGPSPGEPEPDGGMTLTFDFPFMADGEAIENVDAAAVNMFYMTNMVHDFSYVYGFDEAAGNFQFNNYGNGGLGGDQVLARVQAEADLGTQNNASFSPTMDGTAPRIQMFVWDNPGGGNFNITAPSTIAGQYTSINAGFGGAITDVPISAEVVEVNDGVFNPYATDGCEEYENPDELIGKIALIDRGGCEFGSKVLRAEQAGAVAVIVCNFESEPTAMGAGDDGAQVTIPSIMIGTEDCSTIRQFVGNGLEATLVTPTITGPDFLDGDFDNGIIAHEFAHGVSIRMTGGPSTISCLGGGETMGEGWSDFFALIMTVKPGDTGDMQRGVGTYVLRQDIDGTGIRRFPYSTDMNVNPLTYANVASNQQTHAVGEVWVSMLWDLYWAMVDEYGFDNDLVNGTGGNNMAVQLMMDGLKIQPCTPGFVDGRDAILEADTALYDGVNGCLIWEVFARRGCGIDADQGAGDDAGDQTVSFEGLPTCTKELKIEKTMTPLVVAGEEIDVSILVTNHREVQMTGVTVTDEIPAGTSYVDGSCSLGAAAVTINGNMISFDLGIMEYLAELPFTYKLTTDPDQFSITSFIEDVEDVDFAFWFPLPITGTSNIWEVSTDDPYTGLSSWYVENVATESQQIIQAGQPNSQTLVVGANPVLRFYHKYNTENGADGGVVEISTDDGMVWEPQGAAMFRGEYDGFLQYATLAIPNFSAFYGESDDWIATYVDLSEYVGQEIIMRWNFATDDNTAPANGYWYIDDIEIMDMVNYNATACVTSEQGDEACVTPEGRGTVIESQEVIIDVEDLNKSVSMSIFPNPADNQVNLSITSADNQNVNLTIVTLDGKEVIARNVETSTLTQTFSLDVSNLPSGFYFIKASTNRDVVIEKIVIN